MAHKGLAYTSIIAVAMNTLVTRYTEKPSRFNPMNLVMESGVSYKFYYHPANVTPPEGTPGWYEWSEPITTTHIDPSNVTYVHSEGYWYKEMEREEKNPPKEFKFMSPPGHQSLPKQKHRIAR